ncbi:hypothetical protein [Thermodesulfitimonas autotrophica]|uniref:hypothetical protein n=1 Tax=Thermodesulfitimonas autotrophica TaxID=1894989 RepID=UPI000F50E837|nr:hypothetical protein [Thermodesulfitimonas autotrophica]
MDTTKEETRETVPRENKESASPGSKFDERLKAYEEQADWPERLAGNLVIAIPNYIMKVIGLYDPAELIFQVRLQKVPPWRIPDLPSPADATVLHVFRPGTVENGEPKGEFGVVALYYSILSQYVPVWLVLALVIIALAAWWSAVNPSSKLTWREYLTGFLLAAFLARYGIELLSFVFDANWSVVKAFEAMVSNKLGDSFLSTFYNEETKSLGSAILACVAVLSVGVLNWQYTMRKVCIGLLLGLLPLVAVVSIPPGNRRALGIWLRELLSNIFLQTGHAAVFSFLVLLIHASNNQLAAGAMLAGDPTEFWVKLAALVALPGMASLVRRVIGAESIGSGFLGGAGAVLGLGTLLAMGRMLGTSSRGAGSLASLPSQFVGGALKGVGAFALGSVGAVAGSMVTGAAGMGPGAGLMAGAFLGAKGADLAAGAGGTLYDAGKSLSSFAGNVKEQGFSGALEGLSLYDPQMAFHAGQRMLGDNILGRTAGAAMAGGSWLAGRVNPEKAAEARAARESFASLQRELESSRSSLQEMRPDVEAARASHDYAKNLWGPQSVNLREMEAQLEELDAQRAVKEQEFLEAAQAVEESPVWRRREAVEQMAESYRSYDQAERAYSRQETAIESGKQQYQESIKNLQSTEAQYAAQRLRVAELEKKLQSDPAFKQLAKLQGIKTSGGLETRWR